MIKKLINYLVPGTEPKQLEGVQLWYVRWYGRKDKYSSGLVKHVEAFPNQEHADIFADSLREAFKLIRNYDHNTVTITTN
jgi:hypothetical protein